MLPQKYERAFFKWGTSSTSYACFQPELRAFGTKILGFLFFKARYVFMGSPFVFVLGNGFFNGESNVSRLVSNFLKAFNKQRIRPSFYYIDSNLAKTLKQNGYFVTPMGADMVVPLKTFSPTWSSHRWYKRQLSYTHQHLDIREVNLDSLTQGILWPIEYAWQQSKRKKYFFKKHGLKKMGTKSYSMFNRPYLSTLESDSKRGIVRCFFAYKGKKVVGFSFFDPIYKDGKLVGYASSVTRYDPAAIKGISVRLLHEAIQVFKAEGIAYLTLGLMPFLNVEQKDRDVERRSKVLSFIFNVFYRYCPYSFNGISEFKRHFKGELQPMYAATPSRWNLLNLWYVYLHH